MVFKRLRNRGMENRSVYATYLPELTVASQLESVAVRFLLTYSPSQNPGNWVKSALYSLIILRKGLCDSNKSWSDLRGKVHMVLFYVELSVVVLDTWWQVMSIKNRNYCG